jgi:ABC-2 type transport system permease protein
MRLKSGSVLWLVVHDLTLNWRRFLGMFGRLTPGATLAVCFAGGIVLHLLAWPIVVWLVRLKLGSGGVGPTASAVPIICVLAWMSAQGLLGTARTLQERGGMDLLLASPLPMRVILASRLVSIAASSFGSVALLVLPVANMGVVLDGPAWLAVYPTLLALSLIGTIGGMAVAIGLFLWCDPRRARVISQLCAALIGGAFLLAMQVAAMLPAATRSAIADHFAESAIVALLEPVVAAAHGELPSLAGFVAFATAIFAAAVVLLSAGFLRANLRAAGAPADMGANGPSDHRPLQFGSGLAQTLRRKEWRLLCRDHSVIAQLSLQIIYTVPLAVVLLRSVDNMPLATALAPAIVVIAAQIAASLAWITVSGEDAPELIAASPVGRAEVELAKITAIGAPILAILALPLAGLALLSPIVALLATLFAAAAGVSTALLNLWHPMPGNRRGMLRRHSQSKLMALLEHLMALLWAVAIFLAVIGSAFVILPIALAIILLACCRRAASTAPR